MARSQQNSKEPLEFLAGLNNEESRALLDTIDSLRELDVGELVPLPQIIVVGDQSTGKSSVLEAISRVRFPIDAKLCTRFATELVLRRADETKVAVSIRASEKGNKKNGGSNAEPFRRTSFNADSLPSIIDEAKSHMGILGSAPKDGQEQKRFTKDVLRIEISRPDVYPLTLVDLPGIFRNETADQDAKDIDTVNQLIDGYMKQKESIILAVVMATNQLANQDVIMLAKRHDPNRKRTVGVITKPDLSSEEGVTQQFVDVVKGRDPTHKLGLGWFVLRNLSEKQKQEQQEQHGITPDQRDALEQQFFRTGSWSSIQQANRGAQSLRKALSKVLLEHIKANLPSLIQKIEEELHQRQEALRRLGRPRADPDELRSYLHDVAKDFHRLASDGINGRYADEFFEAQEDEAGGPRKLRANLRKLNRAFYTVLKDKGAAKRIVPGIDFSAQTATSGNLFALSSWSSAAAAPQYLQSLIAQYNHFPYPMPVTQVLFNRDIEAFAANNQGRELPGVPSSDLAIDLFRRQAKPWRDIARFHLDLVLKFAKSFVEDVFSHVVGDDKYTQAAILNRYSDPFFDNKRELLEAKLDEILRPYVNGNGLPMEAEFRAALNEASLFRLEQRVVSVLETKHPEVFAKTSELAEGLTRDKLLLSMRTVANQPDSEFSADHVVDMMTTYYDMSHRTFTENVINLVLENCLVCDIPEVLSAGIVFKMSEDRLYELASESEEVMADRNRLRAEIQILEQGLSRCRMYKPRTVTVLPSIPWAVKPAQTVTMHSPPTTAAPPLLSRNSTGSQNLSEQAETKNSIFSGLRPGGLFGGAALTATAWPPSSAIPAAPAKSIFCTNAFSMSSVPPPTSQPPAVAIPFSQSFSPKPTNSQPSSNDSNAKTEDQPNMTSSQKLKIPRLPFPSDYRWYEEGAGYRDRQQFQTLCALPEYMKFSLEELRLSYI